MSDQVVVYCAGCRLEIYENDDILESEIGITHNDFDCLKQAANASTNTGYRYRQERLENERERDRELLVG